MTTEDSTPAPAQAVIGPEGGMIDSRTTFADAVRWAVHKAIADGARTLVAVDPAFDELWPWDDEPLRAALAGWFRLPQRRLVLLAARDGELARHHPRFAAWRRDWSHAIDGRLVPEEWADRVPTLLHDDRHVSVSLRERDPPRGVASLAPRTRLACQERSDALLQRSGPGFALTTLGL